MGGSWTPKPVIPGNEPGTCLVTLTRGRFAIIDAEDADRVGARNWYYARFHTCEYARSIERDAPSRSIALHHFIVGKPAAGLEVDHIDRNGLNNRRSNLRMVTHAVNMQNRGNAGSASGVTRHHNGWRADIRRGNKKYRSPTVSTRVEALEWAERLRNQLDSTP